MCSDAGPVINVDGISKFFEIYSKPSHRLWQMAFRGRRCFYEPFWALRDVSFDVRRGECVGIIGRNGAGKSTLLQVITGTLAPSSGNVDVKGRVAALLELGSGFNPEFTGRENVYLNASILGLTREEIDARFDDIAAFADIGDFIEQPVKSYSSGMVVRLAFAVVAHVDADVLIIDEALSVGDAFFTQKCMRFLRRFIAERTALFVSHDTAAVNSLCNRAILMESGRIKQIGSPKEVTETYLKDMYEAHQGSSAPTDQAAGAEVAGDTERAAAPEEFRDMRAEFINASNLRNDIQVFAFNENSEAFGKKGATIVDAVLLDAENHPLNWIVGGEPVSLRITVQAHKDIFGPIVGFFCNNRLGQHIFGDNTFLVYRDKPVFLRTGQKLGASFSFTMPILEVGDYSFSVAVAEGTQEEHVQHDWKHDALLLRSTTTSCHTGMVGIPMKQISLNVI
ncbi:MAG: ABC transporter ATP-binding protein [Desulfovibrio sp.]|uniref:ABC transporter ATP-binding protein n=1 Tax=Desulfovibrio sp. TaxID=885 RepID=UPI002589EC7B|nr:ABC transporter ATP-binding protein [Desulfovibrio sp.]MCD7984164.1 ABC transporter ATP-binding protein [Desulfovibrio sp.]